MPPVEAVLAECQKATLTGVLGIEPIYCTFRRLYYLSFMSMNNRNNVHVIFHVCKQFLCHMKYFEIRNWPAHCV